MNGEAFIAVLAIGFAAFIIFLVVQIVNGNRQSIWILAVIAAIVLLLVASFAFMVYSARGV
jgi:hypothetical protein